MFVRTTYRSPEAEIMDDLSMEGEMLRKTLDQIAAINKWLGGNKATIQGLHALLRSTPAGSTISIIDLGCGSGDMLRAVAEYGKKNNYIFKLTGIDANEFTVNYARKLSANYPEIRYLKMDVLADAFPEPAYDIALATLFLHHFKNEEIERMLGSLAEKASTGIVINDLHRSSTAWYLFRFISIFISNPMVRKDGAISVLRGFKKKELVNMSKKIKDTTSSIHWKWAFRYQWIIKKT
ncbi:MAG: methyltransferase domain-containing protein [Ferruginibacter sp.]|mgnify:CR=1 FL=1|nr:methyltransferase domain-containing protein [Chitinophagaceae bacterium]MBP6286223.1 methyltransferase domain-containing protein [Ferruginibacter sp.]MBU9937353.1 methyltransferase domain-containing protein [Ferruginibacter sp.]HQY12263.1 methyltransferase domain-containing protein [Ferruginibacter sp.]